MSKTRIFSLLRQKKKKGAKVKDSLCRLTLIYQIKSCSIVEAHLIYCSDLLYFFARYLAEALLGILTKESSLLYLVMLHGVSHTQKSLSLSTRKSVGTEPEHSVTFGTDQ